MREQVEESKALQVYMDACMHCGACTDKCHYYLGTSDPKNMPVARQDLYRKVYQRHFTLAGRLVPWLIGAKDLDEDMLEDWFTYFHQCSQCRRCAVYCPAGIDTAEFTMAGRDILNRLGQGQKYTNEIVVKANELGNNLGLPRPALLDTLAGLEEEILETTGQPVRLPIDEPGAELLLVTPSADFFAEPHVDGLIGYAKVLHQAGIPWTLSSEASEAANFALFTGDTPHREALTERIVRVAQELGVRRLVFGECGHAWRVAHNYLGAQPEVLRFLDPAYPRPEHIVEVTHGLLRAGALRLDSSANDDKRVTFHDSCNIARASRLGDTPGGQFSVPRDVIRAACANFFEMQANTTKEVTFCCGAGGGLLTDELMGLRVAGAQPRMAAFEAVAQSQGVTHIAAMCAICKTQLSAMMPKFGFDMSQVVSVHQLVGDAVVFDRHI
ncbi:MAG: (Fe-S)-binding protein [Gammaproteobacteria bacterium]|nr:(Fe-S)-binding protein [Gammaproteobacteria bacterium]